MMISPSFDLRELVHPDIYNHPSVGDRCADFLHPNLSETLEQIKSALNNDVITVNDWHRGGSFINSGLRSAKLPYGVLSYSGHYFGNACDVKAKSHTAAEVWAIIVENPNRFPFITRMEHIDATPTWVHIEVGAYRTGDIKIFRP